MDLIPVLIGVLVGAVLAALGHRLHQRLRPQPSCSWCATASGWPVRGHDTLLCRGYVHSVRERDPAYGGHLWREPETEAR